MIPLQKVVDAIVYLLVAGLILGLLSWALNKINPPEPWKRVGDVVLVLGTVFGGYLYSYVYDWTPPGNVVSA